MRFSESTDCASFGFVRHKVVSVSNCLNEVQDSDCVWLQLRIRIYFTGIKQVYTTLFYNLKPRFLSVLIIFFYFFFFFFAMRKNIYTKISEKQNLYVHVTAAAGTTRLNRFGCFAVFSLLLVSTLHVLWRCVHLALLIES